MNAWFIRANGATSHNEPGSKLFVFGEPPTFPRREFNYRRECLEGGFARIGWPATGDLRATDWRNTATHAYGTLMPARWVKNLTQFANIRVGDIVAMPADRERADVHFGVVVPSQKNPSAPAGSAPYYYHFDTSIGDWFENAHRVPVHWHRDGSGQWAVEHVPALGGLWLSGFGRISAARASLVALAMRAGYQLAV